MPNAAHNRSERTCIVSARSDYSRVERLSLSACVKGMPPPLRACGKARGYSACESVDAGTAASAAPARIVALAWRRVIIITPDLNWKRDVLIVAYARSAAFTMARRTSVSNNGNL